MVNTQEQQTQFKWPNILSIVFVIILLLLLFLAFSNWWGKQGAFKPLIASATPIGLVNDAPIGITFADLDANPLAYRNKLVRVSGNYTRLSPIVCAPHKGPRPQWGLIAEGFQMEIIGIEEIIPLAPEGAPLVVDGVWRLYEGPLGCGKEPSYGTLWYLEARRIVEPNPLLFSTVPGTNANNIPITNTIDISPTPTLSDTVPTEEMLPSPEFRSETPTVTGDITTTLPVTTITLTPSITPTGLRVTVAATPTLDLQGGNGTPTAGTVTLTPTPTGTLGTGTPDPTNEALPTSPSGTVIPATLAPGAYPSPYP